MPSDLNNAIKTAAERVVKYINDVSELKVETRFVDEEGSITSFDQAKPAASTIIRLDGDCAAVVPLRKNAAGVMEVDTGLFEMHEHNVATAIDYRTRMMDALLQTLKQAINR